MSSEDSSTARHERALAVAAQLRASQGDQDRFVGNMTAIYGALGSFGIDYVLGDVWARPGLSLRDRSLTVLASLVAQDCEAQLRFHVKAALNLGIRREEIDEVLLQLCGYVGFPRAISGMDVVNRAYCDLDGVARQPPRHAAEPKGDAARNLDAAEVLHTLSGGRSATDPEAARAGMEAQLGPVGTLTFEFAFGEIWARPRLSRRDRSLVVLSTLTTLGRAKELPFHIRGALNHGLSQEEIEEVLVQCAAYAGIPVAVEAMTVVQEYFARREAWETAAAAD